MLQLLQKLELHKKQGSETVYKYSHQNLYEIICRLPTPTTKSMFTTETSLNYCSIYKINTRGLIYLEMPLCSPKHLYFDTITCSNLKKVKRFQTEKFDGFFFRNFDQYKCRLNRKGLLFSGRMLVCVGKLPYLEVN